jgi:hypothetical protein
VCVCVWGGGRQGTDHLCAPPRGSLQVLTPGMGMVLLSLPGNEGPVGLSGLISCDHRRLGPYLDVVDSQPRPTAVSNQLTWGGSCPSSRDPKGTVNGPFVFYEQHSMAGLWPSPHRGRKGLLLRNRNKTPSREAGV